MEVTGSVIAVNRVPVSKNETRHLKKSGNVFEKSGIITGT